MVVVVVLQEVLKNLERFDEGLLQTLNSWIVKVQDDPDNKEMVRPASIVKCMYLRPFFRTRRRVVKV